MCTIELQHQWHIVRQSLQAMTIKPFVVLDHSQWETDQANLAYLDFITGLIYTHILT
jgi:hypothetical protein